MSILSPLLHSGHPAVLLGQRGKGGPEEAAFAQRALVPSVLRCSHFSSMFLWAPFLLILSWKWTVPCEGGLDFQLSSVGTSGGVSHYLFAAANLRKPHSPLHLPAFLLFNTRAGSPRQKSFSFCLLNFGGPLPLPSHHSLLPRCTVAFGSIGEIG